MKLIRWILSNIILIAFVLALTYAYVYWDNLTGEDTPAGKALVYLSEEFDEVREFLNEYDISTGGETDAVVAEADSTSVDVAAPAQQPAQQPPQQTLQQPVAAAQPTQPVQSQPMTRPEPRPETRPPMQPPMMRPQPPAQTMQPYASREPQPPVERAQAPSPTASGATAGTEVSTRELWVDARKEFHRGNIEASVNNYKAVIAKTENNYDAYGELGNVYLNSGNRKEAAAAYYEAAAILVEQGQRARAASLMHMLSRLDPEKAQALQNLLSPPSEI
jgi:outer membrane biosynthesis protein TonB